MINTFFGVINIFFCVILIFFLCKFVTCLQTKIHLEWFLKALKGMLKLFFLPLDPPKYKKPLPIQLSMLKPLPIFILMMFFVSPEKVFDAIFEQGELLTLYGINNQPSGVEIKELKLYCKTIKNINILYFSTTFHDWVQLKQSKTAGDIVFALPLKDNEWFDVNEIDFEIYEDWKNKFLGLSSTQFFKIEAIKLLLKKII